MIKKREKKTIISTFHSPFTELFGLFFDGDRHPVSYLLFFLLVSTPASFQLTIEVFVWSLYLLAYWRRRKTAETLANTPSNPVSRSGFQPGEGGWLATAKVVNTIMVIDPAEVETIVKHQVVKIHATHLRKILRRHWRHKIYWSPRKKCTI